MRTWYETLRGRIPSSNVVKAMLESVEELPGLANWAPPGGLESRWLELIRWGFPLWMARGIPGLDSLQKEMASEILASGMPTPETFGEISAAGLCVALGAVAAGRIPESPERTADWRMVWPSDASVDVEATVARKKAKHVQRETIANEIVAALWDDRRDGDLVIHVADPSVADNRARILAAAKRLVNGHIEEVQGEWQVRAEEITRDPTVLFVGGQDTAPPWWAPGNARCGVFRGFLAGPETQRAPSQVRVWFGVPYDSYVNPVMRKADAPQGEPGLPFLVAVDVAKLPGAFRELPNQIGGFLPFWRAVSGILLFQDFIGPGRVGWLWRLVANPHAHVPLPDALQNGRADVAQAQETFVKLRDDGS